MTYHQGFPSSASDRFGFFYNKECCSNCHTIKISLINFEKNVYFSEDIPCGIPVPSTTILPLNICPEMEGVPGYQPCAFACPDSLFCNGRGQCVPLHQCPCGFSEVKCVVTVLFLITAPGALEINCQNNVKTLFYSAPPPLLSCFYFVF